MSEHREHLVKLSLARIGQLGGREAEDAVDAAIAAVLADLRRRPGDRRVRVVTVRIGITPKASGRARVAVSAQARLPDRAPDTAALIDLGEKDPAILFNPLSATHLGQQPLPFEREAPPTAEPAAEPAAPPEPARKKGRKAVGS